MLAVRPPLPWLLAYRLLGVRLPEQYKPWVAQDVTTKWFVGWRTARTFLWGLALVGLYDIGQHAVYKWPVQHTLRMQVLIVLAYSLLASGKVLVKRELRWQRIDKRGRPAPPKGVGLLAQTEAVVAVLAIAIAWTGASAAYGWYGLRDSTTVPAFRKVHCDDIDPTVRAAITSAFTKPGASIVIGKVVPFSGGKMVGALFRAPTSDPKRKYDQTYEMFLVKDGTVYAYATTKQDKGWTNLPRAPLTDRVGSEALSKAAECVATLLRP
jgi:hypothetical protein